MTPIERLFLLICVLVVLLVVYLLTGTSDRTPKSKRARWDYLADGRIVLVDMNGEVLAFSRSPQDHDTARLRRLARLRGYHPPSSNPTPLRVG